MIFAMTYGALLFAGPLERFLGYGVSIAMMAMLVGSVMGAFSDERAIIAGPDSNSTSVLASSLAGLAALQLAPEATLHVALAIVFATALVCAATYRVLSRPGLANMVRFVPFPVMAGFLASSGWLLALGSLTIIGGTPIRFDNVALLAADLARPEMGLGFAVALVLFALSNRLPGSVLMPLVIFVTTLLVHLGLASPLCSGGCDTGSWFFPEPPTVAWLPPWKLRLDADMLWLVAGFLPTMLAIAFVAVIAAMLSLASLEIELRREFDLGHELRVHAGAAAVGGLLGGTISSASISRTVLNRKGGGGAVAGVVAASMALALLLGASQVMGLIARGALGGLVLYLSLAMLKQWIWDVRDTARPAELLQILLIVAITARHGFIAGFGAGVLIACVTFVVTYSRIPLTDLETHLGVVRSSVVRSTGQEEVLARYGDRTRLYRLSGYVFFGSANKIDGMFGERLSQEAEAVILDLSRVSGIDTSAVTVFQRILRRHADSTVHFHVVHGPALKTPLGALGGVAGAGRILTYHDSLDRALEAAEERLIEQHDHEVADRTMMLTSRSLDWRSPFEDYLETREIAEDQALCVEGDRSDEVYFVQDGRFDVLKRAGEGEPPVRLAKVRHGALLGEIAFYLGEPRSATIIATRPSVVRVMRRATLERMRQERPELATQFDHMVIRSVAGSLKRTTQMVTTLG